MRDGTQVVHKFENGYGASVVCHEFSYGGDQGLKELDCDDYNRLYFQLISDDGVEELHDGDKEVTIRFKG